MTNKLKHIFATYQQAFDRFDFKNIAQHYSCPCLISDVDGLKAYNKQQLHSKFEKNCESMKGLGYTGSEYLIGKIRVFGEEDFLVDIAWRVFLAKGPYEFSSFYICKENQQGLKIINAVVYQGRGQLLPSRV